MQSIFSSQWLSHIVMAIRSFQSHFKLTSFHLNQMRRIIGNNSANTRGYQPGMCAGSCACYSFCFSRSLSLSLTVLSIHFIKFSICTAINAKESREELLEYSGQSDQIYCLRSLVDIKFNCTANATRYSQNTRFQATNRWLQTIHVICCTTSRKTVPIDHLSSVQFEYFFFRFGSLFSFHFFGFLFFSSRIVWFFCFYCSFLYCSQVHYSRVQNENNENLSVCNRLLFSNEGIWVCQTRIRRVNVCLCVCVSEWYIKRQQNYAFWRALELDTETETNPNNPNSPYRTVQSTACSEFFSRAH